MKALLYFLGVVLFVGLILLMVVFAGVSIQVFISAPSLMIIVLPAFFMLVPVYKISGFARNITVAFNGKCSDSELKQALQFTRHLSMCLHFSAAIGVLLGLIAMLAMIDDKSSIGYGLSVTLISTLYNFILQIVLVLPIRASIKKKLIELE